MTTRNFRVNNGLECGDITLSASANTITGLSTSAPSGNGDIVRVIGYCLDASNGQIYFNPDGTFVEVTA